MNDKFRRLGFSPADILIPKTGTNPWCVVACDQFTSQPEYWEAAEREVNAAPSTLRLILPEAKLRDPAVEQHIAAIHQTMEQYLAADLFRACPDTLVYVERTQSDGKVRRGLVGQIDLERYDFTPGSGAAVRATEGTVLSRIPPRVRVREHAALEASHVMLLIDDPDRSVIEPLRDADRGEILYDGPLMLGGGHITGRAVTPEDADRIADALAALAAPEAMARKYGVTDAAPLLFAVGDGNHSLATAKQCWENLKPSLTAAERETHPARFALVEVVNLHDDALQFAPIHRVLFDVDAAAVLDAFRAETGALPGDGPGHRIEFHWQGGGEAYHVPEPAQQLAAGTLQAFLDAHGWTVDYIHGGADARELGERPGCLAALLPPMGKDELFKTVLLDGVLPRKTFSMGEARDKRYYLECRKIR